MSDDHRSAARYARGTALIVTGAASGAFAGWLVGRAATSLTGTETAAWLIGRAAGVTAYLLLVALVLLGLVLAHPWASRLRHPSAASRLRLHVSLAAFAAVFTVLHVVVLATDSHAGVGWTGAVLPLGSDYRPMPVTLGVLGLYAGLAAGVTAALAGRVMGRIWLPIHRFAGLSLVLLWVHSVLAGTDTSGLVWMYVATAGVVLAVAASRYAARSAADRLSELSREVSSHPIHVVADREIPR